MLSRGVIGGVEGGLYLKTKSNPFDIPCLNDKCRALIDIYKYKRATYRCGRAEFVIKQKMCLWFSMGLQTC